MPGSCFRSGCAGCLRGFDLLPRLIVPTPKAARSPTGVSVGSVTPSRGATQGVPAFILQYSTHFATFSPNARRQPASRCSGVRAENASGPLPIVISRLTSKALRSLG